ncbi:MAG: acetylornithine/succinylornithine family transaminase [Clostridia bacterium]|nr:acetylornithine/succinylornithine family transaminase [Clostridia bacterium]
MMNNVKLDDKEYVASTYGRFDLQIVKGKGSYVYDETGKEYIDLNTGIAVNTFGYCDKEWIDAVNSQLCAFQHTSNLYYQEPCVRLAQLLSQRTGCKKTFFSNSGAEANECAIKVARKWALDTKGEGYHNIITLKNSFHGRTITTLSATGQDSFHTIFNPFTEGFLYAEANNLASVEALVDKSCCAIMMELCQGEGGVMKLTKEFVDGVISIAKEKNLLVIIDEVQTGNGRSGSLYAFQEYGIVPDIATTAKGLGGGLPIGATMMFEKTRDVLTAGTHGSTFGGNPVACAGAINIIERIDDDLLREVKSKSEYIINELTGAEGIKSVSGIGLMLGIETEKDASEVVKACMEMGALPIKAKNKVRLLPALNIPMDALKKAVEIIKLAAKGE